METGDGTLGLMAGMIKPREINSGVFGRLKTKKF
jgi:hypothetical protein